MVGRRFAATRAWAACLVLAGAALVAGCGVKTAAAPVAQPRSTVVTVPATSAATAPTTTTTTEAPTTVPPTTVPADGPPQRIVDPAWLGGAGDGVWKPAGRSVGGGPALYTTTLHKGGSTYGVAWLDQHRLRLALYAGITQPLGVWKHQGAVAVGDVPQLVAAFNSGFKLAESRGGWWSDGRTAVPLVAGAASLVIATDGTASIATWGTEVEPGPGVAAVRQNLQMLVDAGMPTAAVGSPNPRQVWGDPLHELVLTWRSALAIDGAGQLLYVAATSASPADLAAAVIAAGGREAMELDINVQWVSFHAFQGSGPSLSVTKLLPAMVFPTDHFVSPYNRDFLAAFAR